jgi:hypothetical protein
VSEASRCWVQAEEYHRLTLLAQSGAEATILTSLIRSWKVIADQTDRYVAMKKDAVQKKTKSPRLAPSPLQAGARCRYIGTFSSVTDRIDDVGDWGELDLTTLPHWKTGQRQRIFRS